MWRPMQPAGGRRPKKWPRLVACFVLGLSVSLLVASASQATTAISTNASAITVAQSIVVNAASVLDATYLHQPTGSAAAVTTKPIGGFPIAGASYAVLSTGDAAFLDEPNSSGSSGTNLGGPNVRGNTDFDVTVLRISLRVPAGVNCMVGLDFRFLSEEYPEYVGTAYNDAFIAELDQSTWTTAGSTISAPNNFAFDPAGSPITINAAGVTSMKAEFAADTTFDGGTPLLRAATPITPGDHALYLSIFDQGDHIYDSAVLIDNLRFGTVADLATQCKPGAVPVNTEIDYVALGDSYASGEGTFIYDEHHEAQKCHRGPLAWPRVLEQRVFEIPRIEHKACSGAKTQQLLDWYKGNPPQIPTTPDPDVELVTVTVGGNDVGFSGVLRNCYLGRCSDDPDSKGFAQKLSQLTARLDTDIYPAIEAAYPNARIAHVGYPRITPRPGVTPYRCGWLSEAEQVAGIRLASKLNGAIQDAVDRHPQVEFIDVTNVLTSHELCTEDSWIVDISTFGGDERGHPTSEGQEAYAEGVAERLGYSFLPEF